MKIAIAFFIRILTHRYAYHLYFWMFIFYRNYILLIQRRPLDYTLAYSSASVFLAMLPVYAHFFALRLITKRKILAYILLLVGIIYMGGYIDNIMFTGVFFMRYSLYKSIYDIGGVVFMTTALKYIKAGIGDQLIAQEIKTKQLESELATLRAQINPHFLFNTLNNLYALALVGSKKTPETIIKLSDLMRYILDKTQSKSVCLSDEISFLNNYIELEKLRFESGSVVFNVEGNPDTKLIAPMMFIPFVENAFKHGIDTTAGDCDIAVSFIVSEAVIIFKTSNKLYPDMKLNQHGSGIANVKRRLELIYPNKHTLDISSDGNKYTVRLEITV